MFGTCLSAMMFCCESEIQPPKSSLNSHAERVKNIAGAFDVPLPEAVRDQRILLIDDILTTGTTIDAAIRVFEPANRRG